MITDIPAIIDSSVVTSTPATTDTLAVPIVSLSPDVTTMSLIHHNLGVPFHLQDYMDYCSAACHQMLLHRHGWSLEDTHQWDVILEQFYNNDPVYSEYRWGADPPSLAKTLNAYPITNDEGTRVLFQYRALNSETLISRKIVETISRLGVAPIALVFGEAHWLLVGGYLILGEPPTIDSNAPYLIMGFFVNDSRPAIHPEGDTDTRYEMPHCDSLDICSATEPVDRCGDGIVLTPDPVIHVRYYGTANQFIPYPVWVCEYMTGVPPFDDPEKDPTKEPEDPPPPWDQKFVAVCAYEPIIPDFDRFLRGRFLRKEQAMAEVRREPVSRGLSPAPVNIGARQPDFHMSCELVQPTSGDLITPDQAIESAFTGLDNYGLGAAGPSWKDAIATKQAKTPVLVSRLDRPGSRYYLVELRAAGDSVPVVVRVDAYSGTFLGAIAVSETGSTALPPIMDTEEKLLASHIQINLENILEPVELNSNNYKGLFWRPCRESFSPFYPFFMFTTQDREIFIPLDRLISVPQNNEEKVPFYERLNTRVSGR